MADIELPTRRRAGGSFRAVRAPTAADVPAVRIARDPGVRTNAAAFGAESARALEQGGGAIMDFGAQMAEISESALQAERKMKVNRAAANAAADLKNFRLDLETDTDYATYGERYRQRAEAAFNAGLEGLDEKGQAAFRERFHALSLDEGHEVRKMATGRLVNQVEADLDTTLDQYAGIAAGASSDEQHAAAVLQATQAVDDAVASGIIDPVQGGKRKRKFAGRLDEVAAMQAISGNAEKAAALLADPEAFPNLDEKRRQALLDSALRKAAIAESRRVAEENRQDRLAEKRLKAEGDQALKEAYDLLDAGSEVTPEQLDRIKNNPGVSPAEYKGLLSSMETEGEIEDDPATIALFMPRIHEDDLVFELTLALDEGLISSTTYRTLINTNKTALADARPASPYKSGREFLSVALDPGQLGGDATLRQPLAIARAAAMADYDAFFDANPETTRQQALEQSRELMERYQNVAFDQMRLALPRPRGYGGSKRGVTMAQVNDARDALAQQIEAGTISDAMAAREIDMLNTWERILTRSPGNGRNSEQ